MIPSSSLQPSSMWKQYAASIAEQRAKGAAFDDILEMNVAIKQRTLEPYQAHWSRLLGSGLWTWPSDEPRTIIEVGAGYGAMLNFWPDTWTIYHVDLPEMLEVQQEYIAKRFGVPGVELTRRWCFVPITEADSIYLNQADTFLFSVWALTETNLQTWAYWTERASDLAGAYIMGHEYAVMQDTLPPPPPNVAVGYTEPKQRWPWEALAKAFPNHTLSRRQPTPFITAQNLELVAWR